LRTAARASRPTRGDRPRSEQRRPAGGTPSSTATGRSPQREDRRSQQVHNEGHPLRARSAITCPFSAPIHPGLPRCSSVTCPPASSLLASRRPGASTLISGHFIADRALTLVGHFSRRLGPSRCVRRIRSCRLLYREVAAPLLATRRGCLAPVFCLLAASGEATKQHQGISLPNGGFSGVPP